MSEEPHAICEYCREEIDPGAPDTVSAEKIVKTMTFGETEYLGGLGALFHEACWQVGSWGYRRTG